MRLGVLVVCLAMSACDCPRLESPNPSVGPGFMRANYGRIAAAWNVTRLGGKPSYRFLTARGTTGRELPLDGLGEAAIGTRSALVLEAGTGTIGPRRAALLLDETVRVITLDLPILYASVVFDGTQYHVVYIDMQDVHAVAVDEDGAIGTDFTITARRQSSIYLLDAGTDGAGNVVVAAPTDNLGAPTEVISIDRLLHQVSWKVDVTGYTKPVFYDGNYRMLGINRSMASVSRAGVASSITLPVEMHALFASTEALFGVAGRASGYSIERFDPGLMTHQPTGIVIDAPSFQKLPSLLAVDGDRVFALRRSPTSPRDLAIVEYSSRGEEMSSEVVATDGDLVEHGDCLEPNN